MISRPILTINFLRFLSALPFSIFYSSLRLYLENIGFQEAETISLVGSFLAFNFGLSLFGGYLAEKYISLRSFFLLSSICQAFGCFAFSFHDKNFILWLISCFLLGSMGLSVCLNMMLTRQYAEKHEKRDKAFFWMYMPLNIGYALGYAISGYLGNNLDYSKIGLFVCISTSIGIILMIKNWNSIKSSRVKNNKKTLYVVLFSLSLLMIIRLLLVNTVLINSIMIVLWLLFGGTMFFSLRKNYKKFQSSINTFYFLLFIALAFWSIYFLSPTILMVFIKDYVNLHVFGVKIAPQWIQNINTLVIILGTILIGANKKTLKDSSEIEKQFSISLFYLGLGISMILLGVLHKSALGKISLIWVVMSYVFQSIGELSIGPIGFALIGRLIPPSQQSIMMGIWVTSLGISGLISSKIALLSPYGILQKTPEVIQYKFFFFWITLFCLVLACFVWLHAKKIKLQPPEKDSDTLI